MAITVQSSNRPERKPLTAARLREMLSYDPVTGLFAWRCRRNSTTLRGAIAGYVGRKGRRIIGIDGRTYLAHRLVWLYVYGRWPDPEIDHENTDQSDNRLTNLREASSGQNKANVGLRADNTSGFKGISLDRRTGRWRAEVQHKGRRIFLGTHATPEQAHAAYLRGALTYHGTFANGG